MFFCLYLTAWSTTEIIKDWKSKISDKYLTNGDIINDKNHGYLIMDKTRYDDD